MLWRETNASFCKKECTKIPKEPQQLGLHENRIIESNILIQK